MNYRLSDFDYHLPADLIAQSPASSRSASRLLVLPSRGASEDRHFADLPHLLKAGDLLVLNDSKVIPARLHALKETGGAVEMLVERVIHTTQAQVMLKASKKPASGAQLLLQSPRGSELARTTVSLVGRDPSHDDRFVVDFPAPVFEVLEAYGEVPLPPYITHDPTAQDVNRYQTIYAEHPGSVAAPTAGLHFDDELLTGLAALGVDITRVTLHVGSGTFSPVRTEDLSQHTMHSEWCSISHQSAQQIAQAKAQGRRVIAVGTTSLRTLESAGQRGLTPQDLAGQWDTNLFVTPGYDFRLVDGLITNFHLPKSTLLMLVSAFAGYERIRQAYAHAIAHRYRFFSYGDAMFLERAAS
jgi:S-adenosylmethionine:tRNA ribosyltransferase-isomerase